MKEISIKWQFLKIVHPIVEGTGVNYEEIIKMFKVGQIEKLPYLFTFPKWADVSFLFSQRVDLFWRKEIKSW